MLIYKKCLRVPISKINFCSIVLQPFELPRCVERPQTLNPQGINERFSFDWLRGLGVLI